MERTVEPEWLDELPADDPQAVRSRGDLRRLNWFMGHAGLLARALRDSGSPRRVVDVGCGDGALTLQTVMVAGWSDCEVVLVDRRPVIASRIRDEFASRRCRLTVIESDVFEALEALAPADVIFTNLFLHHFGEPELRRLLGSVAARTRCFAACEPRRSAWSLLASHMVGLIGCNAVTRHDAPASVRAGFQGRELSALWPQPRGWSLTENRAGKFSHLFVARSV